MDHNASGGARSLVDPRDRGAAATSRRLNGAVRAPPASIDATRVLPLVLRMTDVLASSLRLASGDDGDPRNPCGRWRRASCR